MKNYIVFLYYYIPSSDICYWRLRQSTSDPVCLGLNAHCQLKEQRKMYRDDGTSHGVATHTPRAATEGRQMSTRLLFFAKCLTVMSDTFLYSFLSEDT